MKLRTSTIAATVSAVVIGGVALTVTTAHASTEQRRMESGRRPPAPGIINARGAGVFPHSVDYEARAGSFIVGSLHHSTISTVGLDGTVRTLVDDSSLVAVQAVRADPRRGRIVASNVDYGLADRSTPAGTFHVAGVGSYDAASGRRQWYADLAAVADDGKQHLISDVAVAPDGTAYAVDELSPTVFRIDPRGRASVLLRDDLLAGTIDIPNFLTGVGLSAVEWLPGDVLIMARADGALVRLPIHHPDQISLVRLSAPLAALTADVQLLPDGSLAVISSGLLSGTAAVVQRVRPARQWTQASVTVTDAVTDPVSSGLSAGPCGLTYALSGGLAALLGGQPNDGFTLRAVKVG